MPMLKWIIALTLLVILPSQAEDLSVELSARASVIESIDGVFNQQRRITALPLPLNSSGRFHYKKNEGIRWQTLLPVKSSLTITPKGLSMDGNNPQNLGAAQFAQALLGIFSGEFNRLQEQFNIIASGDSEHWQLTLLPKNKLVAARITEIRISGAEMTESIEVHETNGDNLLISFSGESIRTVVP